MPQAQSQLDKIAQAMAAGAVLVTPTVRAARQWRARVERLWAGVGSDRSSENRSRNDPERDLAHAPAQVLPWRGWTAALHKQALLAGTDDRVLLNPVQMAALWENVLRSGERMSIRPLAALARLCGEAHALLHRYLGVDRLLHMPESALRESSDDARQFQRWLREVETFCKAERLLPSAALEAALSQIVLSPRNDDGNTQPPDFPVPAAPFQLAPHYLLIGFDRLTPAQEHLLNALKRAGSRVDQAIAAAESADSVPRQPRLISAMDGQSELLAMAQRLRQELESGEPLRRISIVVPDLQARRPALERVLRTTVSPDLQDVASHAPAPWEFSTGMPLSRLPLFAHALLLLRWTHGALPVASVSNLLLSPFLSIGVSAEAASEMDAAVLRDTRRLRPEWTVSALAAACQKHWPAASEHLRHWHGQTRESLRGRKNRADWVTATSDLLQAIGWPGERPRSSDEFQMLQRWNELLDQVSSLDLFGQSVTFTDFVTEVERWAAETTFAPENTGAPLQFMTPSEAAGTVTDLLWCAHADEARWNARRAVNALLPWALQADLGMPGTDAARDLDEAKAAMHRFRQSAGEVVFSYAALDRDGEVRVSALLESTDFLNEHAIVAADETAPVMLEEIDDTDALPTLPEGVVSGGVGVLKTQAACAFRAFAERRLFATTLDTPDLGLDAAERGNLMHHVLEAFWRETETQARLLELSRREELQTTLSRHVDDALRVHTEDLWSKAYLRVQRQRLLRLLTRWLEYESKRPPFRVLRTEQKIEGLEIASLRMDVRVDRIDEVEIDGARSLVLIDYKSGTAHVNGWMGERPEEPQLPLYAVATGVADVRAIAFGSVKAGEKHLGLKSFPAKSSLLTIAAGEDDGDAFAAQMEEWQQTLERLAQEFAAGEATVSPREYPGTCKYCEQRMLCRLNPETLERYAGHNEAGGQA